MDIRETLTAPKIEQVTHRRVIWRILPFVFLMYLVNYVDRTALAFAAPNGMNEDLQLTATMFGFAAGIFFIGYILLEVPSNLLMQKYGARKWIARIMVSWGIIAALTAFVQNYELLLLARFLLGVAEAGFAPAIFLYLTFWFSNRNRVKAFSIFLLGIPMSSVITAPLATWLIGVGNATFGLEGWRFMIFTTGVPAIIIGVIAFFYLTDRPEQAKWLTPEQKDFLHNEIEAETDTSARHDTSIKAALRNPKVWALAIAYMGIVYGLYGIGFFVPSIVDGFSKQFGTTFSPFQTSLLIAIPYAVAATCMVFWARHSAHTGDIGWHVLTTTTLGAIGILISAYVNNPFMIMVGVTLCALGVISSMPVLWGLPARILSGVGAAAGLAVVNTIGNFGGFAGPYLTGWLTDASGSYKLPFTLLAIFLILSGVISVLVQRSNRVLVKAHSDEGLERSPRTH